MKKIKSIRSPVNPLTTREVQLCFKWLTDLQARPEQMRKLITKYRGKFVKRTAINDVLAILCTTQIQKSNLAFMARKFHLKDKQTAAVAAVSERTYQGWEASHHLSVKASKHLLKIVEVYRVGMQLYDKNKRSLITWLNLEIPALGHKVPVNMMISSWQGANTVNNLLWCMEFGILV